MSPRLTSSAPGVGITSCHAPSGPTICSPGHTSAYSTVQMPVSTCQGRKPRAFPRAVVGVLAHAELPGYRLIARAGFVMVHTQRVGHGAVRVRHKEVTWHLQGDGEEGGEVAGQAMGVAHVGSEGGLESGQVGGPDVVRPGVMWADVKGLKQVWGPRNCAEAIGQTWAWCVMHAWPWWRTPKVHIKSSKIE